jgi:hypothetical protein
LLSALKVEFVNAAPLHVAHANPPLAAWSTGIHYLTPDRVRGSYWFHNGQ